MDMNPLTITYSLADQNFGQTKSLGIFNVSTQLLENMARRVRFTKLSALINSTLDGRLNLPPGITVRYHDEAISGRFGRVFWDQWGVYEAAKHSGNQWLFLPKGFVSFLKAPAFKLAVYVYDTIHDFYRNYHPGAMSRLEIKYFTRCLKETIKRSDVIFTDSDFANNELKRLAAGFKIEPPPIITAGVGFNRAMETVSGKRDSVLLLTSAWPHKMTKVAVDFVRRWHRESGFSGSVELVGGLPRGTGLSDIEGWRHYPRLSEAMYRKFLAESRILLFFSEYEGFGMPPVEAIMAGTCPVFSDIPVTREVMGDAGYPFLNGSYESFARAMDMGLSVTGPSMKLWADQLIERHNWDKVVERVVNGLAQAG